VSRIATIFGVGSALAFALLASAETYVWVDAEGTTHITGDPAGIPAGVASSSASDMDAAGDALLRGLWDDVVGPPPRAQKQGSADERTARIIRGAAQDIERGEYARASAALEAVLRNRPADALAHWYLAELDRSRERYDSARTHLYFFLSSAGDDLAAWRERAERRLAELDDERHLADEARERGSGEFVALANDHFRVSYDAELGSASPDYAATVLTFLEQARRSVSQRLGVLPAEPMGVVFYGRAAYVQEHKHRFSFKTVSFFDGRIHVVSAAHPERELRELLFHEYTHAVSREETGGDRPFWLNEGLAELSERDGISRDGLTRSERVSLHIRIVEGGWIPLRRLAPSFAGLDNEAARVAYLEATAAAAWIEAHTDRVARRRMLMRLGRGARDDEVLRDATGLDTNGIDAAVREAIRAEFPVFSSLR